MSYTFCLDLSFCLLVCPSICLSTYLPSISLRFINFDFLWDSFMTVNVLHFLYRFINICLTLCWSVSLSVCISVSLPVWIHEICSLMRLTFVCQCHTVYLDLSLSTRLSVALSFYLSVCLSICVSLCLSECCFLMNFALVCQCLTLSVSTYHCLSDCLLVCLSICASARGK